MKTSADQPRETEQKSDALATGLGWFSIGLGLAEMVVPRALAKLIGVRPHPLLFEALGMREIASGIGILSKRKIGAWLWSRVAGDVMDLSLLGAAFASDDTEKERVEAAAVAVIGVTVLDVIAARRHSRSEGRGIRVSRTIAIDRSPEELYDYWRNLENLPRFMRHLESVRVTGSNRSHWVAKAPAGRTVEWDAEITEERPNSMIAWRSLPGADVDNEGSVRFERAPGGRGTFVRVKLEYDPPGGVLGAIVARLFGESPDHQIQSDLYRLKQVMETGQVTTTDGQPAGRTSSLSRLYDTENARN
jgi:uncharacterized membrane protein